MKIRPIQVHRRWHASVAKVIHACNMWPIGIASPLTPSWCNLQNAEALSVLQGAPAIVVGHRVVVALHAHPRDGAILALDVGAIKAVGKDLPVGGVLLDVDVLRSNARPKGVGAEGVPVGVVRLAPLADAVPLQHEQGRGRGASVRYVARDSSY